MANDYCPNVACEQCVEKRSGLSGRHCYFLLDNITYIHNHCMVDYNIPHGSNYAEEKSDCPGYTPWSLSTGGIIAIVSVIVVCGGIWWLISRFISKKAKRSDGLLHHNENYTTYGHGSAGNLEITKLQEENDVLKNMLKKCRINIHTQQEGSVKKDNQEGAITNY
eukprot:491587_1